jgi:hypothetical protein
VGQDELGRMEQRDVGTKLGVGNEKEGEGAVEHLVKGVWEKRRERNVGQ